MQILGGSRTYPTKCRDCGAPIFFHTNGYGDVVLFDDLGPPWPIHPCYEARLGGEELQDRDAYRAYMVSVYGKPFEPATRSAPRRVTSRTEKFPAVRRQVPTLAERRVDIARCEPENFIGRKLQVVGFVHDFHEGWSITRLAESGSMGYAVYRRIIGTDLFSQLTVVDSDFMSYTAVVPAPSLAIRRGAIVALMLEAVEALMESLFICRSLNVVRWKRN